jgi:hypothetical protein
MDAAAEWGGDAGGGAGETQNGALSARKRHELGADMAVREAKVRRARFVAVRLDGHTQPPAVPLCCCGARTAARAPAAWAKTTHGRKDHTRPRAARRRAAPRDAGAVCASTHTAACGAEP